MGKAKADIDVQAIADQAREEFDLGAELRGRSRRTKTVRVYMDEVAGERLGGAELRDAVSEFGMPTKEMHYWGIVGERMKLDDKKDAAQIKALNEEAAALQKTLDDSALDIELTSVPKLVKDDANRAARAALGIRERVTESHPRVDEFIDENDAQLLQRCVASITKVGTGAKNKGLSIESARNLREMLPEWEWQKINEALKSLLYEKVIASAAVENPDF
jgi:hypothetical protein